MVFTSAEGLRRPHAVTIVQALILSVVQGAFELFPVSSLGHTVIIPPLLGWGIDRSSPAFLAFIVVLHLGTAAALLWFFWRDWLSIIQAVFRSIVRRRMTDDVDERLGWLIVVASIPAGVLGAFFKDALTTLFGHAWLASLFLVANGFVMLAGEHVRRARVNAPTSTPPLSRVTYRTALIIGAAQSLALLPGFSRSGTSIVAGLRSGLDHVDAARFSFLLATPLILAAGLLAVPDLFQPNAVVRPELALMGFAISGLTAYVAVRFLMQYFRHERLDLFGFYCIAFGLFSLVVLGFRVAL